ncbi:UNVERIFIED_CONTAM: hypothetical protein GTU68_033224 [Idotea baltica]|nr:hypothetical protein [Idotea baltica]
MKAAMFDAELGDDVFGQDPSVNALQEKAASLFGMEGALFCPSGTMTNQIAFKVSTQPMEMAILDTTAHPYRYEGGGLAFTSGLTAGLLDGKRGIFTAEQVVARLNPVNDPHQPPASIVSVENTCNKGGGAVFPYAEILRIRKVCDEHGLHLHLDGARLFNAIVASDQQPKDFGKVFDTISICLSKGLGAPVGSLLLGSAEKIEKAKRVRKVLGGGMRQAGFLAAAGIYALDHQVERLVVDHTRAKALGTEVEQLPYVESLYPVETNILVFKLKADVSAAAVLQHLEAKGVLAVPFGGQYLRFVTHLDVTDGMIDFVIAACKSFQP